MNKTIKLPRFRCRTIPLRSRVRTHGESYLERAPAFSVNPRGVLVHRVRHVAVYRRWDGGGISHLATNHLCGNSFTFKPEQLLDVLVADPPEDRLLCSFCHCKAEGMRLPPSDTLARRHVHRGILVPHQVCCLEKKRK